MTTCLNLLEIREACPDDVETLIQEMGQRDFFQDRLSRQKTGDGVLLVAWLEGRPVGDSYLWKERAEEPEIRDNLPGVPLLTHVEVREDLRSRGIGSTLIAEAEKILARDYSRVALAVEESNVRAVSLYERLGYRDWHRPPVLCYPYDDGSGKSLPAEKCRVFVKDLPKARVE